MRMPRSGFAGCAQDSVRGASDRALRRSEHLHWTRHTSDSLQRRLNASRASYAEEVQWQKAGYRVGQRSQTKDLEYDRWDRPLLWVSNSSPELPAEASRIPKEDTHEPRGSSQASTFSEVGDCRNNRPQASSGKRADRRSIQTENHQTRAG